MVMGAINTVPLYKTEEKDDSEVRPLGVLHEVNNFTGSIVAKQNKGPVIDYLEPLQLGLSKAGAHKLVHSVRMATEMRHNQGFVTLKLDFKNAHSAVSRAAILEQISSEPTLQHLAQHTAVFIAPPTVLVSGGKIWGTPAGDGGIQGGPEAGAQFNIAIHSDLRTLDAEMRAVGGWAIAGQDDVFVHGPTPVIFHATDHFAHNIKVRCNLDLQRNKTQALSLDDHPPDIPDDIKCAGQVINGKFEPGFDVYGCPVGTDTYVNWWLNHKVDQLQCVKSTICNVLESDRQALWNILNLSFSKKFDYLAALCYPSTFSEAGTRFDGLVWDFLQKATGLTLPMTCEDRGYECALQLAVESLTGRSIQHHIARLSVSRGGLGIRSVTETAGPAFLGGLELALPSFTGDTGTMTVLESVIGRPGLGGANRWSDFLRHGSRTSQELLHTWTYLRNDANQRMDFLGESLEGVMSTNVDSVGGESVDGSTRSRIIQFQEKTLQQIIQKGLNDHPNQEEHAVRKFNHKDKVSQAWLSALPTALSSIPSEEFQQAMAFTLFVPSPACATHVGTMVCGKPLDPHGEILMCAPLPFDTFRTRHDRIKVRLESMGNRVGAIVNPEPYGLFSTAIPAAAHNEGGDLHQVRDRQGLIPDLHVTFPSSHGVGSQQLCEIKCLSAGLTYYHGRDKSVDICARQLPASYSNKAKKIDRKYCGTDSNQIGPVQQRLNGFGDLQCLVVGQFGEVSQHLHDLLAQFADCMADKVSRASGRPVSDDLKGLYLHQLRRELSVTAIRAQSACLLSCLGHMSPGARQAAQRRNVAKRLEEVARRDAKAHWEAEVRSRRLLRVGRLRL